MLPFALGLVCYCERPYVHIGVLSISVVLQSFRRPLRTREKTRSHREHGILLQIPAGSQRYET